MSPHAEVSNFLLVLEGALGPGRLTRRILAEAQDHLESAVARLETDGLAPDRAAREAILLFGAPETLAQEFAADQARSRPRGHRVLLGALGAGGLLFVLAHAFWQPGEPTFWLEVRGLMVAVTLAQAAWALWRPGLRVAPSPRRARLS